MSAPPRSSSSEPAAPLGRILTFYSYKGGTGRSMALANVAWILANSGYRVLAIDWDLEAPGLHRYFGPFLDDPELTDTLGLVDLIEQFQDGARQANRKETSEDSWFQDYASMLPVTVPIKHAFPSRPDGRPSHPDLPDEDSQPPACLHFVGAGRQGVTYAQRATAIDWDDFYKLGGGVFLEAVKARLRATYDFVLIDSRTGLSDTSGICTVQMPDDLVVCYTLNRQSILGAAATAESASNMRRKPSGEYGLRIWPVAMRVELAEQERLNAARQLAREHFGGIVRHLSRERRRDYWGESEVVYVPFYAYEEVLATVNERPGISSALLTAMERLAERVTGVAAHHPYFEESARLQWLARYRATVDTKLSPATPAADGIVRMFLSYSRQVLGSDLASQLVKRIEAAMPRTEVFFDDRIPLGVPWREFLRDQMRRADVVLSFVGGPSTDSNPWIIDETLYAQRMGKRIVPLVMDGQWSHLPKELRDIQGVNMSVKTWDRDVANLIAGLSHAMKAAPRVVDPEDLQKGRWGGAPNRDGFSLTAVVQTESKNWFTVVLRVHRDASSQRATQVHFHLHETFNPVMEAAEFDGDVAELEIGAWGAFTVGVEIVGTKVTLELDLAHVEGAPATFRER